jgi:uncharacterized membrane protein YgcG
VVTADLRYQGSGAPAAAVRGMPPGPVALLFAAVLAVAIGLGLVFLRREAARGRFGRPEIPERPDEEWLRQNVFDLTPEEVGTLWDGKVGPPEVAAVLARLVAEGKLASEVRTVRTLGLLERSVLHLTRKADRAELYGYEKKLLDQLFFDRTDETDTDRVRKHYKSTGFDPAGLIAPGIKGRLQNHPGLGGRTVPPPRRATLALLAAGLALLGAEALTHAGGWLLPFVSLFGLVFLYLPGLFAAIAFRGRIERLFLGAAGFLLPMIGLVAASALVAAGRLRFLLPGLLGVLALAALDLAAVRSLFHNAQTRESASRIQKRKLLAAARRHLARELRRPAPALTDAWFPYLLAFGLGGEVDRWFRAFGGAAAIGGSTGSTGSFGSTGSTGGSTGGFGGGSWTGGGGAFGGGGASASWAAAASGMASGVSAPSSGGSGGGGGGGGGSSGGGGGGGW